MPFPGEPEHLWVLHFASESTSRDEIGGIERLADGRMVLKVRVRAVPQDGEANAVLVRLLAKALRIPASAVRLEAGASGRRAPIIKAISVQPAVNQP